MAAWERLGRDLDAAALELIAGTEIGLSDAIQAGSDILDGKVRGRIIVDVSR
jgi:acrylyl-CoA reductase (NADPH)